MTLTFVSFVFLASVPTMESCIRDVFAWMTSNKLFVNPNKTENLLFNPNDENLPIY